MHWVESQMDVGSPLLCVQQKQLWEEDEEEEQSVCVCACVFVCVWTLAKLLKTKCGAAQLQIIPSEPFNRVC